MDGKCREVIEFYVEHGITPWLGFGFRRSLVLTYLDGLPPTPKRRAALAWAMLDTTVTHYLPNGHHFIFDNRDYIETYYLMGGNLNCHITLTQSVSLKSSISIDPQLHLRTFYTKMSPVQLYVTLGVDCSLYPFRNFHLDKTDMREAVVRAYRFDVTSLCNSDISNVHSRTMELWNAANDHVRKHLTHIFQHIWSAVYRNLAMVRISVDILRDILKIVPNQIIQNKIDKYEILHRCSDHDIWYHSYIMGLPLDLHDMNSDKITSYIEEFKSDQTTPIKRAKRHNKTALMSVVRMADDKLINIDENNDMINMQANTTDSVHMEPVESYSPYDVVRYVNVSGKVVQLVRSEFMFVMTNGTNPWTREMVPPHIINTIMMKISYERSHKLPICNTLAETLDVIVNGPKEEFNIMTLGWMCPDIHVTHKRQSVHQDRSNYTKIVRTNSYSQPIRIQTRERAL